MFMEDGMSGLTSPSVESFLTSVRTNNPDAFHFPLVWTDWREKLANGTNGTKRKFRGAGLLPMLGCTKQIVIRKRNKSHSGQLCLTVHQAVFLAQLCTY